jgi:hypothetical protein
VSNFGYRNTETMASWNLDTLSTLLESMQGNLNALKQGHVGSTDAYEVQKRFMSTAEEILAMTSDPVQSVKNIARGVKTHNSAQFPG